VRRREFLEGALTAGASALSWALLPPLSARAAERDRVEVTLTARPYRFPSAAGAAFSGLAYNGRVPGPLLRVRHGQTFRARYLNRTGGASTIHWHGMILPNDMDGVPGVTQTAVPDGGEFLYTFKPGPPGFRWYHAHVGDQIALGLFGGFLVEDPRDRRADVEAVLVLHDVPDMASLRAALAGRSTVPMDAPSGAPETAESVGMSGRSRMGTLGMPGHAARSGMAHEGGMPSLPGMPSLSHKSEVAAMGDEVGYRSHCLNGAAYPHGRALIVKVGQSVRLRVLNASPTLTHYLRLGGHQLRVTHADGNPLPRAVTVDALRIGVGERYDAWFEVTRPGAWLLESLMADPNERRQSLLIRTSDAGGISPELPPDTLEHAICFNYLLAGLGEPDPPGADPYGPIDVRSRLVLGGGKPGERYWTIDGKRWPHTPKVRVRRGDRVLVEFVNPTGMDHPMHLHGHVFDIVELSGRRLAHPLPKDTSLVPAGGTCAWRFIADSPPGRWLLHCHNLVHMMDGMMNEVDYT
jgi:FtsP/CotA-like multicopper oxidase with cupredoxin domain